jgi:tetratricopeptide (TPR) repeat protein
MRTVSCFVLLLAACHGAGRDDSTALRAEIDSLLAEERVEEALARADAHVARDPTRAEVWRQRARCLVLLFEFDSALVAVERAIDLEPRDPWSHYERGYLLRQMGRDEDAISSFSRAIDLDPRHFKAYEHRGGAHLDWGRNEEALADFTRAIACWDADDRSVCEEYSFRARALTHLGRSHEAERDMETAAAIRDGPR